MKIKLGWPVFLSLGGLATAGGLFYFLKLRKKPVTTQEHLLLTGTVKELAAGKPVSKSVVQQALDIARRGFPQTASRLKSALKGL